MYGDVYKFSKHGETMVNNVIVREPYKTPMNDVEIIDLGSYSVFKSKFLQVDWNYNGRVEIYLNEAYSDSVCGLCGNSNGEYLLEKKRRQR